VIDRVFLATYGCIALGVLISTVQASVFRDDRERASRIDRLAGLGLPVLFVLFLALCLFA
jgi:hypothetical protein